ncbi:MAG: DUF4440 domain-containing protein [Sphingobacteriales bacterium]|nr:MAG: DUF4440 domain-containing protein [Sphingobacteriales bacterium]
MKPYLLTFYILLLALPAFSQLDENSGLYKTIMTRDSLLFDVGFNTCDIRQFENLLSDSLKFYHDKDGISDKAKFISDLKNGLCKDPGKRQVKRILIKGDTEIYPLHKNGVLYGAVQNGKHMFYEGEGNQPGIAKFTNVWQLEKGEWKLLTSFSFDHQAYQQPGSEKPVLDSDSTIRNWLQEHKIPVLGLGIIENGQLQQVKMYGELIKGVAAPYNTIFNVASLTKPVTAIVALKLVSQGKWDLDEPLSKYWTDPDIAQDPRHKKLTTRLVLSHQTGFPNWRRMNQDQKLSFQFEPGTQYQYSGEGMEYLRKALEKKFKRSLQALADELIFQPLQMTDTRYIWNAKVATARYAAGYDVNGKVYETVKNKVPNAADDLLTTIQDYGKFLVSVMHSEGLSGKVSEALKTRQVASTKGKHFGLGFEIYDLGSGQYALSHGGSDQGVHSIVFILPKTGQGLLIFTNSDTGTAVYEPLIRHYLGSYGLKIIETEMN